MLDHDNLGHPSAKRGQSKFTLTHAMEPDYRKKERACGNMRVKSAPQRITDFSMKGSMSNLVSKSFVGLALIACVSVALADLERDRSEGIAWLLKHQNGDTDKGGHPFQPAWSGNRPGVKI